jgi:hypothetical protein
VKLTATFGFVMLAVVLNSTAVIGSQGKIAEDPGIMTPLQLRVIAASKPGGIELVPPQTRIVLIPHDNLSDAEVLGIFASPGPTQHIFLLIRDHFATKPPGVLYHLYLDLPPDTKPEKEDRRYIGSLNFFGRVSIAASPDTFVSYDITLLIRSLAETNRLTPTTTVTILPAGTPVKDAAPRIGRVELVAQ